MHSKMCLGFLGNLEVIVDESIRNMKFITAVLGLN